jgi:hypothetical protein
MGELQNGSDAEMGSLERNLELTRSTEPFSPTDAYVYLRSSSGLRVLQTDILLVFLSLIS